MYFRNRMYLSQDEIRDKIQTKTKQMLERKTFKKTFSWDTKQDSERDSKARNGHWQSFRGSFAPFLLFVSVSFVLTSFSLSLSFTPSFPLFFTITFLSPFLSLLKYMHTYAYTGVCLLVCALIFIPVAHPSLSLLHSLAPYWFYHVPRQITVTEGQFPGKESESLCVFSFQYLRWSLSSIFCIWVFLLLLLISCLVLFSRFIIIILIAAMATLVACVISLLSYFFQNNLIWSYSYLQHAI